MKHQLEQSEERYVCSVCGLIWKSAPVSSCPGVRVYAYSCIPWEQITTKTELRRRYKSKPGGAPIGCYLRRHGKPKVVRLYAIKDAVPLRQLTERQKSALEKARQTLKERHTCQRCSYYDESHGTSYYNRKYRHIIYSVVIDSQERRLCWECRLTELHKRDRQCVVDRMGQWHQEEFVIVDFETTGLPGDEGFQIVEAAILNKYGEILFHSLIKPDCPMPPEVSSLNGITDTVLEQAPRFVDVWPDLLAPLSYWPVYTYNAEFDRAALLATAQRYKVEIPEIVWDKWHCLMISYAAYHGEWSYYHEDYVWQSLDMACCQLGIPRSNAHRAEGDARDALALMRFLAAQAEEEQ